MFGGGLLARLFYTCAATAGCALLFAASAGATHRALARYAGTLSIVEDSVLAGAPGTFSNISGKLRFSGTYTLESGRAVRQNPEEGRRVLSYELEGSGPSAFEHTVDWGRCRGGEDALVPCDSDGVFDKEIRAVRVAGETTLHFSRQTGPQRTDPFELEITGRAGHPTRYQIGFFNLRGRFDGQRRPDGIVASTAHAQTDQYSACDPDSTTLYNHSREVWNSGRLTLSNPQSPADECPSGPPPPEGEQQQLQIWPARMWWTGPYFREPATPDLCPGRDFWEEVCGTVRPNGSLRGRSVVRWTVSRTCPYYFEPSGAQPFYNYGDIADLFRRAGCANGERWRRKLTVTWNLAPQR